MGLFKSRAPDDQFDPAKVDVVAIAPDGLTVELVIVGDRPWTGSDAQLRTLQAKVQTYVGYALDGPMVQEYPETEALPWRIVVHAQTGAPDTRTSTVLSALAERLPAHGGELHVRARTEAMGR